MRWRILFLFGLFIWAQAACAQEPVRFEKYFVDRTMRVDYFHIGSAQEEMITLDRIYRQGPWAGSQNNLIDGLNLGRYGIKVYDKDSGTLIFSRGFDSYFGEYKTTGVATGGEKRTFHESALFPYPRNPIRFTLEVRDRENRFQPLFSREIDPSSIDITGETSDPAVEVFEIHRAGETRECVDLAVVGEGYTAGERDKFVADLARAETVLFSQEPYKTYENKFNLYGILKISNESGCDEPRRSIYKNTAVSTTFNSLGLERYLLTEDNRALRDVAGHVPYDALIIMVNHKRYGGGGIYNLYCVFTADNPWSAYLMLHEFGHSFSGLADEYYTSSVAYNDFYPKGIEPLERNITALLDPQNVKWKDLLTEGVEVPTPWEKKIFEGMEDDYQKVRRDLSDRIADLKQSTASTEQIEEAEKEDDDLAARHVEEVDGFFAKSEFAGVVGAFEGAGYSSQGLFRPMLDCLMFSRGDKPLCRVCEKAVIEVILFHSGRRPQ